MPIVCAGCKHARYGDKLAFAGDVTHILAALQDSVITLNSSGRNRRHPGVYVARPNQRCTICHRSITGIVSVQMPPLVQRLNVRFIPFSEAAPYSAISAGMGLIDTCISLPLLRSDCE